MKKFNFVPLCLFFLACYGVVFFAVTMATRTQTKEETAAMASYNTQYLEEWRNESDTNTIRMIGAWVNSVEDDVYTLEDQSGNLWVVRNVELPHDAFVLLWLDNSGTADYINDDVVVRVWQEVPMT